MRYRLKHMLLLVPVLVLGCFDIQDIENLTAPTDVEERFEDSISGNTKQIVFPKSTSDSFTFLWVTDMHFVVAQGHYLKELGEYAHKVGARFILHTGDLADHGLEEEYDYLLVDIRKYLEPYGVDFISGIGNHDLSGDGWDAFKEYIGPSVFTFNYGNTFFIVTDTANNTAGRSQLEWIEDQLEHSSQENKFLLSHFPFYDGEIETPTIIGDPDERYKLMYLCDDNDVDYVLTGHKHSIEEYDFGNTTYLCGGMASKKSDPINGEDLFYRFEVNGDDIDFDKVYLDDLD